ncbi:MAG: HDOD domain-containing protein [Pirellula sp.]|nr:HDOD domain-containing protein [Pirellula sp.]
MSTLKLKPSLADVLANTQIPALPTSAMKLLELSQDPNKGPADYAQPIEADVGLMGQVLRFVNSSYFGFSREISSVQQALTLVGIRTIKNFALWSAVFSIVPNPKIGPFDLRSLWQDSLRRALFARSLGRELRLANSEELFAAALLQDMAIPFLLKALPSQYEQMLERRVKERLRLSSLEREAFGWDHAQAAAHLCRRWHLPEDFAVLVERHPSVHELLSGSKPQIAAACVALAALLPACKDTEWSEESEFQSWFERIDQNHQISLPELMAKVDEAMEGFAPILNLPKPEKPLAAYLAAPVA